MPPAPGNIPELFSAPATLSVMSQYCACNTSMGTRNVFAAHICVLEGAGAGGLPPAMPWPAWP